MESIRAALSSAARDASSARFTPPAPGRPDAPTPTTRPSCSATTGALTDEVVARCLREGLAAVYLLPETAGSFFPRHWFVRIERDAASDAVKQSAEFRELCPSSSVAMVRQLA